MEAAHTHDVAARYERFGRHEAAHHSDVYQQWALAVSEDDEVCGAIGQLPADKRQPNIVFACCRVLGLEPGSYQDFRTFLLAHLDEVGREASHRSTQTNEPARTSVLLPVLAHLSRQHDGAPLALLEVGASAGLCLWPDAWDHRYVDRSGALLAEVTSPGAHGTFTVTVKEPLARVGLPSAMPGIAARRGLDLNPLDPTDADDRAWLRTLVWPGQDHRLTRLDAALDAAAQHPAPVVQGDLRDPATLDRLLDDLPTDAVPVLFHTAVLAYLEQDDRTGVERQLLARVRDGQCHWVSNEGQSVLPELAERLAADATMSAALRKGSFVVALDGEPLYQADGHAGWVLG